MYGLTPLITIVYYRVKYVRKWTENKVSFRQ